MFNQSGQRGSDLGVLAVNRVQVTVRGSQGRVPQAVHQVLDGCAGG